MKYIRDFEFGSHEKSTLYQGVLYKEVIYSEGVLYQHRLIELNIGINADWVSMRRTKGRIDLFCYYTTGLSEWRSGNTHAGFEFRSEQGAAILS